MRGAIRNHIEVNTPYIVCADVGDGVAAITKTREFGCDLVVLDLSMPGLNGAETASVLGGMKPRAKIVGFTMFDREFGHGLYGASGFDLVLSKSEGLSKLTDAIKTLLTASAAEKKAAPPIEPS